MNIIDKDGTTHDVTGSGQGLYNTIAGSIGALGVLAGNNGGGLLGGLLGGNRSTSTNSDDQPITRYDAAQQIALAAKDAEIAQLKAISDTDAKMVAVYTELASKDNAMRDRVDAVSASLNEKITAEREARLLAEKEQAVFNQTMVGTTSTIAQQIANLNNIVNEITTNVVPANKVCATGCCCNN